MTAADRIAPLRRGTRDLLVLTGLVERLHQLRTTVAAHPHEHGLDTGIQLAAAPMLLKEGVEGGEQVGRPPQSERWRNGSRNASMAAFGGDCTPRPDEGPGP
jgi:hypothetical protein